MELRDYRRAFVERRRLLAGGLLAGLLVGLLVALLVPGRYASQTAVLLSAPTPSPDAASSYQSDVLIRERVAAYVPLVTQDRVTQPVADRVGGGLDARDVADDLGVAQPDGTPLLLLTATASSPQRAQAVAAATSDAVVALVGQIETASAAGAPPQAVASVVQPATLSPVATGLGAGVQVVLGGLVGLVLGAVLALVAQARDTSVRSEDDLRAETRLPVLATIPSADRAESTRKLRTSLDHLCRRDGPRVLVFTGPRGGEGTSTTVAALASAIAGAGRRVVVVEGDLRRPRLAVLTGASTWVGLVEVLRGRVGVEDALVRDDTDSFDVLIAGSVPDDPADLLASSRTAEVIARLSRSHHTVLVDAPPALPTTDAAVLAALASGVVVLVARARTTAEDVDAVLGSLRLVDATATGTVLTEAGGRRPRAATAPAESSSRNGSVASGNGATATGTGRGGSQQVVFGTAASVAGGGTSTRDDI